MTADEKRAKLAQLAKIVTAAAAERRAILAESGPAAERAAELLRVIGGYQFPDGTTIYQASTVEAAYDKHGYALESVGVILIEDRQGQRSARLASKTYIFFDVNTITKRVLAGTAWADPWQKKDYVALLLDLKGSRRYQRTVLNRKRVWGIEVPLEVWRAAVIPAAAPPEAPAPA